MYNKFFIKLRYYHATTIFIFLEHASKTKGLKFLSYTGPSLWNNLNENLKRSNSINDFNHIIKEFYFEELKKKHES